MFVLEVEGFKDLAKTTFFPVVGVVFSMWPGMTCTFASFGVFPHQIGT